MPPASTNTPVDALSGCTGMWNTNAVSSLFSVVFKGITNKMLDFDMSLPALLSSTATAGSMSMLYVARYYCMQKTPVS
jgi:hypothetical protein